MSVVVDCDGDYYPYYHINGQFHCGCHCYKFPAWSHTTPPPTFRPSDLNCWCLHLDGRHWQGQPTNPSSWGDLSVCQSAIIKEFPVWRQHVALKWPGQSVRVTSYLRMYWELWQLGHVWVGDNPDLGEQPDRTVSLLHWEGPDQLSSAFVLLILPDWSWYVSLSLWRCQTDENKKVWNKSTLKFNLPKYKSFFLSIS